MPYGRKRIVRKRRVYRRKPIKRTYRKKRTFIDRLGKQYFFKQMLPPSAVTLPAGPANTFVGGALTFEPVSLPNWNQFAGLYDEYMVTAIAVKFASLNTTSYAVTTNSANAALFYTAVDLDDGGTPTSLSSIQQNQSCKLRDSTKSFTIYFKPRFAGPEALTSVASTTIASGSRRGWINTSNTGASVQFYGIKYGWYRPIATSSDIDYAVSTTVYIKFRGVI